MYFKFNGRACTAGIKDFSVKYSSYVKSVYPDTYKQIQNSRDLDEQTEKNLRDIADEFGLVVDRLRDEGRLVTAGAIAGPIVTLDLRRLYLRRRTLIGSTMHTRSDFAALADLARTGSFEPLVADMLPLRRITDAQSRFVAKDFVGKLVLDPWATTPIT